MLHCGMRRRARVFLISVDVEELSHRWSRQPA
jgi:hypothetical protein